MVLLSKSSPIERKATTVGKTQFVTKFSLSEFGFLEVFNGGALQSFDPNKDSKVSPEKLGKNSDNPASSRLVWLVGILGDFFFLLFFQKTHNPTV